MRTLTNVFKGMMSDIKVIFSLLMSAGLRSTGSLKERLDSFYRLQAKDYDTFRKKLLAGREELVKSGLSISQDGLSGKLPIVYDMGGGTGSNIDAMGPSGASKVFIVDLCAPLLEEALRKIDKNGWKNVVAKTGDARNFLPGNEGLPKGDLVFFSYSLSMMQDWTAAILNAKENILSDDGIIAVCDFYAPRKWPRPGMKKGGFMARVFWPAWFSHDDVHLSEDLLPFLLDQFDTVEMVEGTHRLPFLPKSAVPYFIYIGRKKAGGSRE